MISLDTPLAKSFRFYDPHVKWLAPGGLTVNQLADALYAQWLKHKDIKARSRIDVTRESALNTVVNYIKMVFNESVSGHASIPEAGRTVPARVIIDPPPKRTKCCGRK